MNNEKQEENTDSNAEYGVLTLANHILDALGQEIVIDQEQHLFK